MKFFTYFKALSSSFLLNILVHMSNREVAMEIRSPGERTAIYVIGELIVILLLTKEGEWVRKLDYLADH